MWKPFLLKWFIIYISLSEHFLLIFFDLLFCEISASTSYILGSISIFWTLNFSDDIQIYFPFLLLSLWYLFDWFLLYQSSWLYGFQHIHLVPDDIPPFLIFVNWFPSRTEINIPLYFLLDNFLWIGFLCLYMIYLESVESSI